LANYLSTDELLEKLEQQEAGVIQKPQKPQKPEKSQEFEVIKQKRKVKFKLNRKFFFFLAIIAALFHIFYVSIPLLSDNRGINAFGVTTILAVPSDQELGQFVNAKVVLIEQNDANLYEVGDNVVVYGEYGTDLNWVVEIVSIDENNHEAEITFDGVISHTVNLDDIEGKYVKIAGLMGIISYISSNLKGYIFLLGTYIVGFSMVYYFYIRKKKDKPV